VANLAETIRHIPFFSGLAREDLARIVGKLEEVRFSAGQVIVKQGEIGDALFMVQTGAVEVVLEQDGRRVESVAILGPYECFGEMSLFTGQKRSATVTALIDSAVFKLSKETWEELLAQHPSLSLHFCKVLSQRLAETDRDISKGRGAFNLAMEDFFSAQPANVQDFLIRTSMLKTLDAGAIQTVLSFSEPGRLLGRLSLNHPIFLRIAKNGSYEYLDYLRDFLAAKLEQTIGRKNRDELHLRLAAYFLDHAKWAPAIYHYVNAEAWKEAVELMKAHGDELLESESPREILEWLSALPLQMAHAEGYLARLQAEAHVRLGDLDAAVRSYREFLAQKQTSVMETLETAGYYQELAQLHHKKGEVGEALGCLRLGMSILEEGKVDMEEVQAMHAVGLLQQRRGLQEAALRWGGKALNVVQKLGGQTQSSLLWQNKKWPGLLLALATGAGLGLMPPPAPLDESGMRFLATLAAAAILWMVNIFDEYIIALMLLLSWLLFSVVPSEMALGGFSKSSWFFVLGVLGIGAAVTKSGLLYRVSLQVLRRIPRNYNVYTLILTTSGLLATPLLPDLKARIAIMAPISQAISETLAFKPRSNGSAGLTLSSYMGFSQMSFMFLTGAPFCLIGWNLFTDQAKSEFGWGMWTFSALPAGIFMLVFLFAAIHLLFRLKGQERLEPSPKTLETQLEILGPLTTGEWLSLAVLAFVILGWLGKPLHGIHEAWVALGAVLVFLTTGVLDKAGLKNNIDWACLLLLGVISSLAVVMPYLKVDRWLTGLIDPFFSAFSFTPVSFLVAVNLLVYFLRFLLNKTTTVILSVLTLTPLAQELGIHPGVLLLAVLMGTESWFLPYQTDSYQIVYYSTEEKAFSHAQARKLMVAKFLASLLAIAISVPYWRMLGLIK